MQRIHYLDEKENAHILQIKKEGKKTFLSYNDWKTSEEVTHEIMIETVRELRRTHNVIAMVGNV